MLLALLFLVWNHNILMLKLHQKKSYLNERWLLVGRFKVGSVLPEIINKEILAQFIYKST